MRVGGWVVEYMCAHVCITHMQVKWSTSNMIVLARMNARPLTHTRTHTQYLKELKALSNNEAKVNSRIRCVCVCACVYVYVCVNERQVLKARWAWMWFNVFKQVSE